MLKLTAHRRRLDGLRCRAGARGFVGFGLSGHSCQRVDVAERYGFEFALSTIKLRGFGGNSEFRDYDPESFALIASSLQHRRAHRPSTGGAAPHAARACFPRRRRDCLIWNGCRACDKRDVTCGCVT
jgi:hypothetical protein